MEGFFGTETMVTDGDCILVQGEVECRGKLR